MILVLLSRFCESGDSLSGYKLCQYLLSEGYDINVTTTSTGAWLKSEIKRTNQLTTASRGSVTLLEPKYLKNESPSPEWIAKLHKQYFGYLSELQNVDTIIGTLPATAQTAVDLKRSLNCKLVLLPTIKIEADQEELKTEINTLAEEADEIWSFGSDTYCHYQTNIFQEVEGTAGNKHKEILLQPFSNRSDLIYYWNRSSSRFKIRNSDVRKLVSVWNKPYLFFNKGRETYSKGSNIQNFQTLGQAFGQINANAIQRHMGKIQWNIHGLKFEDPIIHSIENKAKPNVLRITAFSAVNSIDDLTWKNCQAFIVPEIVDESFNFIALSAIWLGIPTLVSSQSSIGKFLLSLSCPEKSRAVVILTGDPELDKETWIEKIYKEILNDDAKPAQWARQISEYLQSNPQLWKVDLSLLNTSHVSDNHLGPINTKTKAVSDQGDISETKVKVSPWQPSNNACVHRKQSAPEERDFRRPWTEYQVSRNGSVKSRPASAPLASQSSQSTKGPVCPYHRGDALNIFCEPCGTVVCNSCKSASHWSHDTVPLKVKSEEIQGRLKALLPVCATHESEIANKLENLRKSKEDVEASTEKAIAQMRRQHESVKLQLDTYLETQLEIIKTTKKEQRDELEEEESRWEQLREQRKNLEERGRQLLERTGSSDFVSDSNTFLMNNQLQSLPENDPLVLTSQLVYKPPSSWKAVESQEFQSLMQDQILGHFGVKDERLHQQEMNDQTGSAKMRFAASILRGSSYSMLSQTTSRRSRSAESLPYSSTYSLVESPRFTFRNKRSMHKGSFTSLIEEPTYLRSSSHAEPQMRVSGDHTPYRMPLAGEVSVELESRTTKSPSGTHLKVFHDALFTEESMWICGWTKNTFTKNDTVLLNVHGPRYEVMVKQKRPDEHAHITTMMLLRGESIFFAKRGGKEIHSFNTHSHIFCLKHSNAETSIEALCCSKDRFYAKTSDYIKVFDFRFNPTNPVPMVDDDTTGSDVDMCFVQNVDFDHQRAMTANNHVIVFSKSAPNSYVRAVNMAGDVMWQIDCRNNTELDSRFDPCSVSASTAGDIFIADRGTHKIYLVDMYGANLRVLLDEEREIFKPSRVRVDTAGRRLVVINKVGLELRNYKINTKW